MIEEILEYAKANAPKEVCGVIGIKDGKHVWLPITNVSKEEDTFKFDGEEYIKAQFSCKVQAIFHSHPNGVAIPSQLDYKACEMLNMDYLIIDLEGNIYLIQPLFGREYKWGQADCFTFANDFYMTELGLFFKREDFSEFWWENTDRDYFNEYFVDYGFKEVEDGSLNICDLILFNVQSTIPNHCGVYTGNSTFAHHARNRLSVKEELYPKWGKYKSKVLRHESLFNG